MFQSALADDITLADGKTVFYNAKIVGQDEVSVTIKHSAGIARVMIPDLPPELRTKFKYVPDAAKQTVVDEKDQAESRHAQEAAEAAHIRELNIWNRAAVLLSGKILSVERDGVLLSGTGFGDVIFVKNIDVTNLVDNQMISVAALPDGTHQYTSANSALRTIPAFDAAKP